MNDFPSAVTQVPSHVVRRDYHDFAKGYGEGSRKRPVELAWILEREAVEQGWIVGRYLGSETELIARFGASRDTVREAIRLLEARGSILIERGRHGGLRLAEPDLDWSAGALAMFLHASGFSTDELEETLAVAQPLLEGGLGDHLISQLLSRTHDLFVATSSSGPRYRVRGFQIATRLIQHYSPIPVEGIRLGCENYLCEKFRTSRPTFRQALRILDDLGTLQVQRGRGGGYTLKRPSCIGVVRQMFALFASRQQTLNDVLPGKWAFDIVKLRLAMRKLQLMNAEKRTGHLQWLSLVLSQPAEPSRWCLLQQALGRIVGNPLVNTLAWSLVAYDVRVALPTPRWIEIEEDLRRTEAAVVEAVCEGLEANAVEHMRRAQILITDLLRVTPIFSDQHSHLDSHQLVVA